MPPSRERLTNRPIYTTASRQITPSVLRKQFFEFLFSVFYLDAK